MGTHKIEWHSENVHGIALVFLCISAPDQDHFHCLFYYLGRVIAH